MTMTINTLAMLLEPWLVLPSAMDPSFSLETSSLSANSNLTLDSRQINQGDVFVAVNGHAADGRKYIAQAIQSGAVAVITQADSSDQHGDIQWQDNTPIIYFFDLPNQLSALSARFYNNPSQSMPIIGVTGTNGKTTITQLIAQWIDLYSSKAAVMGTTGNGFLDHLHTAKNTTADPIDTQKLFAQFQAEGADYMALEVSSHGLVQGRVKAVDFAVGVFTNLSRDHLDYHGTMEEYARAKQLLFTQHNCQHKVINYDDEVGRQWLQEFPEAVAVSLLPLPNNVNNKKLYANSVDYSDDGITLSIDGDWGKADFNVPLIGAFNASNVLVALASLLCLGFELPILAKLAPQLNSVIGRMELFQAGQLSKSRSQTASLQTSSLQIKQQAKLIVDYAHTPDALEQALKALRVHCLGQLWVIFGCGGDRDIGKRPLMTQVAEKLADKVIITDDNPRSESPTQIVDDMLKGAQHPDQIDVIHSREQAISYALEHATAQDMILIAGKGHETYQLIGGKVLDYSDRETAQKLLGLNA